MKNFNINKTILFCIVLFVGNTGLNAQDLTRSIMLKVQDSITHTAIVDASVRLLPANVAIRETGNGLFHLPFQAGTEQVEISHVGYQMKTIPLFGLADSVTVVLSSKWNMIEEIPVHTGYESISQIRNTGSVESISQTDFNRSNSPDLIRRLTGVSTVLFTDWNTSSRGIQPKINVRGETSLLGDVSPLIILDNFPYEGDLSSINLDEVESVTILKDAAASAIWGAKAGNGVIVITTKKGQFNSSTQFELNSSVYIAKKPNLFYDPILSSAGYINMERMLFDRGFFNSTENSYTKAALSPAVELLIRHRDGLIDSTMLDSGLMDLAAHDVRDDYLNHVYRDQVTQRYTLSATGGRDAYRFRLSGNYEKAQQNTYGDGDHKFMVRAENEIKVSKRLSAQVGINYTKSDSRQIGLPRYGRLRTGGRDLYPYARFVDEDGSPAKIAKDYRFTYTDGAGDGKLLNWDYVPLREELDLHHITNDVLLNLSLRYRLRENLFGEVRYNYNHNGSANKYLQDADHYETRNLINRFTVIEDGHVTHNFPLGGILRETDGIRSSQAGRFQLNWNRTFGRHQITSLAGTELRQVSLRSAQHTTYGYDPERLTYSIIDFKNYYPVYDGLAPNSLLASNPSIFSETTYRDVSLFMNAIYDFDSRYVFSVNARRDAANVLGMETNQRWKPLWSASAAWNVSEEEWFGVKSVNRLKLRVSHGYSGNIDKSRSAHTILRMDGRHYLTQYPYATILNPPNPSLQWETVGTTNIGIDFGMFNNRITGSVEWYTKKTTNLLGTAPVDPTTGFSNIVRNNASTDGKGVEVALNSRNLILGQFEWSSRILLAHNETKVVEWLNPLSTPGSYVGTGRTRSPLEGNRLYSLYSFKWGGLDPENGNPLGVLNGEVTGDHRLIRRESEFDELVNHGSAIPLYHGSLLNRFRWKQMELSANIAFRAGYYFRRGALHYQSMFAGSGSHQEYLDRWQQPGDELITNVPSLIYPANSERDGFYQNSEVTVARGDHIRLLDVRFDYNINKYVRLFANMGNAGILWRANDWGLDPDYGDNIPAPRNYSFGVTLKM